MTLQSIIEPHLQPYFKKRSGLDVRYTNPLRPDADGETLSVNYSKETWYDHKDNEGGHLVTLAQKLGLEVPRTGDRQQVSSTKRGYDGLADYARAHALRPEELKRYKWNEVTYQKRPALKFPTDGGYRYRFLDGQKPTYKSDKGYKPCWYGIGGKFIERASEYKAVVFCNGEISTIAATQHGLPAFCVTSGEKAIPDTLLNKLGDLGKVTVIVALDCDAKGRQVASDVTQQFKSLGYDVHPVDLGLTDGGDLADWLLLHNGTSLTAAGLVSKLLNLPAVEAAPVQPGDGASVSQQRPPRFEVMAFDDMRHIPPAQWIVPGVIQEHGFNVIFGPSGSGKTFLSINYAFEIAQNKRVMYVAGEGLNGLYRRGLAWCQHRNGRTDRVTMVLGTVAIMDDVEYLSFRRTVEEHKPDVIFIDTLARAMVGTDENSSKDMGIFVDRCNELQRDFGVTVVMVHHTNKGGYTERGSGALRGAADVMTRVTMIDDEIVVECEKVKEADPFDAVNLALLPVKTRVPKSDGSSVEVEVPVIVPAEKIERGPLDKLTNMQRKVLETFALETMGGACTFSELCDAIPDIDKKAMHRVLSRLKKLGFVGQSAKRDPYQLTTAGRRALGLDDDLTGIVTNNGPQTPPPNVITPNPDMFEGEDLAAAVDPVAYYEGGL